MKIEDNNIRDMIIVLKSDYSHHWISLVWSCVVVRLNYETHLSLSALPKLLIQTCPLFWDMGVT